jgi:purine-cytosine permease-like protein
MTFCIMLGAAGPHFDLATPSAGTPSHINAKRLTFFSLCLSASLAWAPLAADYYVYYSPRIKHWRISLMTTLGITPAVTITLLLGAGLGTAVSQRPEWAAEYDGTPGSLLVTAYTPLGAFGQLCAAINVFGVVANSAPGAYSMAMNFQMLGDGFSRVPRPVFTVVTTAVYASCAIAGRDSLFRIFKSFLPLVGYWIVIWLVVVLEEDLVFNRGKAYDWAVWNSPRKLPVGVAAAVAFLVGWVGAIVGMVRHPVYLKSTWLARRLARRAIKYQC